MQFYFKERHGAPSLLPYGAHFFRNALIVSKGYCTLILHLPRCILLANQYTMNSFMFLINDESRLFFRVDTLCMIIVPLYSFLHHFFKGFSIELKDWIWVVCFDWLWLLSISWSGKEIGGSQNLTLAWFYLSNMILEEVNLCHWNWLLFLVHWQFII